MQKYIIKELDVAMTDALKVIQDNFPNAEIISLTTKNGGCQSVPKNKTIKLKEVDLQFYRVGV
jgi:hypothetical protein